MLTSFLFHLFNNSNQVEVIRVHLLCNLILYCHPQLDKLPNHDTKNGAQVHGRNF